MVVGLPEPVILLGIAFLAGLITAISPCVLPVLPILLGGGASGRRPFGIILGLVGSFSVFTVAGAALLDSPGPAPGHASEPRHRPAPPAGGDPALPGGGPAGGAAASAPHAPAAHREQRDRARREPRPRLRPLRRPCSGRGDRAVGDGRRRARDVLRGRRLRERRCCADARDCRREQAAHRERRLPPAARGDDPARRRRADRRVGDRDRPRRRPAFHDGSPRLHRGAPGEGRAERDGEARARPAAAHRRRARAGRVRHCAGRTGARRDRRLDQHRSGLAPPAPRPGRPDRLLDVLVRQLPPHAAPPQGLGPQVPGRRADDRRRPLARVRLRARARQRARRGSQARDPLPGRARQRLRHLDELREPVLAGEVPDRPLGRVRYYHYGEGEYEETEADPPLPRGRRRREVTEVADRTPSGPLTPESYLGFDRLANFVGSRVVANREASYRFPRFLGPASSRTRAGWSSSRSGSWPGAVPGCGSSSPPAR